MGSGETEAEFAEALKNATLDEETERATRGGFKKGDRREFDKDGREITVEYVTPEPWDDAA